MFRVLRQLQTGPWFTRESGRQDRQIHPNRRHEFHKNEPDNEKTGPLFAKSFVNSFQPVSTHTHQTDESDEETFPHLLYVTQPAWCYRVPRILIQNTDS